MSAALETRGLHQDVSGLASPGSFSDIDRRSWISTVQVYSTIFINNANDLVAFDACVSSPSPPGRDETEAKPSFMQYFEQQEANAHSGQGGRSHVDTDLQVVSPQTAPE